MSDPSFLLKLAPRDDVVRRAAALRKPVVFTNGVFDVLHRGHASYLAQSRDMGNSLIVAINTDASARRLNKGPDRPINSEEDRAALVAALGAVTLVTWFDEDTPYKLLEELRPNVYVKGGDYDMAKLPEADLVRRNGGRAISLPLVGAHSTSKLLDKIRLG